LFEESEEFGASRGLGFLRGRVRRFPEDLVVPQVGWNQVRQQNSNRLFAGIKDSAFFYFVHSYYCEPVEREVIAGKTDYGVAYASVIARENLYGVQFHPEKSQADGLRILANFARG